MRVSVSMPAGAVAAATVESLAEMGSVALAQDHDTYIKIVAPCSIELDLDDIGARIGRRLSMAEFLGAVSTFAGRVVLTDRTLTICSDLPGLHPDPPPAE